MKGVSMGSPVAEEAAVGAAAVAEAAGAPANVRITMTSLATSS